MERRKDVGDSRERMARERMKWEVEGGINGGIAEENKCK